MVVVVEILTTDGISFSAKSAKDEGISFELTILEIFKNINMTIMLLKNIFFINLIFKIPNYYKTNS